MHQVILNKEVFNKITSQYNITNENDLSNIVNELLLKALPIRYTVEATCNTMTFMREYVSQDEAKKEFANQLYKHLCDNRWITLDKRSMKEIIDSGIYVDFNFKLEMKQIG